MPNLAIQRTTTKYFSKYISNEKAMLCFLETVHAPTIRNKGNICIQMLARDAENDFNPSEMVKSFEKVIDTYNIYNMSDLAYKNFYVGRNGFANTRNKNGVSMLVNFESDGDRHADLDERAIDLMQERVQDAIDTGMLPPLTAAVRSRGLNLYWTLDKPVHRPNVYEEQLYRAIQIAFRKVLDKIWDGLADNDSSIEAIEKLCSLPGSVNANNGKVRQMFDFEPTYYTLFELAEFFNIPCDKEYRAKHIYTLELPEEYWHSDKPKKAVETTEKEISVTPIDKPTEATDMPRMARRMPNRDFNKSPRLRGVLDIGERNRIIGIETMLGALGNMRDDFIKQGRHLWDQNYGMVAYQLLKQLDGFDNAKQELEEINREYLGGGIRPDQLAKIYKSDFLECNILGESGYYPYWETTIMRWFDLSKDEMMSYGFGMVNSRIQGETRKEIRADKKQTAYEYKVAVIKQVCNQYADLSREEKREKVNEILKAKFDDIKAELVRLGKTDFTEANRYKPLGTTTFKNLLSELGLTRAGSMAYEDTAAFKAKQKKKTAQIIHLPMKESFEKEKEEDNVELSTENGQKNDYIKYLLLSPYYDSMEFSFKDDISSLENMVIDFIISLEEWAVDQIPNNDDVNRYFDTYLNLYKIMIGRSEESKERALSEFFKKRDVSDDELEIFIKVCRNKNLIARLTKTLLLLFSFVKGNGDQDDIGFWLGIKEMESIFGYIIRYGKIDYSICGEKFSISVFSSTTDKWSWYEIRENRIQEQIRKEEEKKVLEQSKKDALLKKQQEESHILRQLEILKEERIHRYNEMRINKMIYLLEKDIPGRDVTELLGRIDEWCISHDMFCEYYSKMSFSYVPKKKRSSIISLLLDKDINSDTLRYAFEQVYNKKMEEVDLRYRTDKQKENDKVFAGYNRLKDWITFANKSKEEYATLRTYKYWTNQCWKHIKEKALEQVDGLELQITYQELKAILFRTTIEDMRLLAKKGLVGEDMIKSLVDMVESRMSA